MILDRLIIGKNLTRTQSKLLFRKLLKSKIDPEFGGQLLTFLQKKGENSEELTGFINAVRSVEKPIRYSHAHLVDGCGTGGDAKHTFNISTLACLIASAAGAKVAKHGNRSVSSQCGSADLLEASGINIEAPKNKMLKSLKNCNFAYFHAPLYHPIFKSVQPIRTELAKKRIKTIFNLSGPLLNPLRPKHQLIGVWRKDLLDLIAQTAKKLKFKHVIVLWNTAGYDEITTGQATMILEVKNGKLKKHLFSIKNADLKKNSLSILKGGTVNKNKRIALRVLSGRDKSARFDVVILNAGMILYVCGKAKSLREGIALAKKAVLSGKALQVLSQISRLSHGA